MKLKQVYAALVLSLALAFSTFAGEISCGGVVNPPPPPQSTGETNTALTEMVVSILEGLLSLS